MKYNDFKKLKKGNLVYNTNLLTEVWEIVEIDGEICKTINIDRSKELEISIEDVFDIEKVSGNSPIEIRYIVLEEKFFILEEKFLSLEDQYNNHLQNNHLQNDH